MAIANSALNILAFPQRWDGAQLTVTSTSSSPLIRSPPIETVVPRPSSMTGSASSLTSILKWNSPPA